MKRILIFTLFFTSIGSVQSSVLETTMKEDKEVADYLQTELEQPKKEKVLPPGVVKMNPLMEALIAGGAKWEEFQDSVNEKELKELPTKRLDATSGLGDSRVVPDRYSKVWREAGINPNVMSSKDMENTYQKYKKEQYLEWGYILLGVCALIGAGIFITKIKK